MPDVISKFYIHRGSDSSNLSLYQDGISGDQTSWVDPSPLAGTNWYKLYGITMTGQIIDSGDPIPVSRGIPKGPQWATQLYFPNVPGASNDYAGLAVYGSAVDSSGNVYVCGHADPYGSGIWGLFVAKYSAAGVLSWRKLFLGSISQSQCQDIVVDKDGNILVTGWCCGTVDFDGHTKNANQFGSIFVLKLSSAGTYIWSTLFGGGVTYFPGDQAGFGIATDNNGNIWITGSFVGNMTVEHSDFPGATGSVALTIVGSQDIFMAKFLTDGSVSWAKKFGSNVTGEIGYGIAVDPVTGDSFITGTFNGTVDFSQGTGTPLTSNSSLLIPFVAKFSTSGASLASVAFQTTGTGSSAGIRCRVDSNGNLVVGGTFKSVTITIGGIPFSNKGTTTEDVFITTLNKTTLVPTWSFGAFVCGSSNADDILGLAIAPNGNIVFAGRFWNTMDIGSIRLTSNGVYDGYVAALTSAGVASNAFSFGTADISPGSGADRSTSVAVASSGVVYVPLLYAAAIAFSTTVSLPTPTPSRTVNGGILAIVL
jgi:hypothetical protein